MIKKIENEYILDTDCIDTLQKLERESTFAEESLNNYKQKIVDAMKENNVIKIAGKNDYIKYDITRVIPKDTENFNIDEFILSEDATFANKFVKFEQDVEFDLEKFKKENEEMYKKYLNITDIPIVDTKSLKENFNEIYTKYTTITKSIRKESIRITKKGTVSK